LLFGSPEEGMMQGIHLSADAFVFAWGYIQEVAKEIGGSWTVWLETEQRDGNFFRAAESQH